MSLHCGGIHVSALVAGTPLIDCMFKHKADTPSHDRLLWKAKTFPGPHHKLKGVNTITIVICSQAGN